MKRKLTEVEYNQLSVETIISNRISSSTTSKYKGHLKRFTNFLGLDDNIDVMDRTTIDHINEENINNWLQQNLRKKDGKMKKACSLDIIRSSIVYLFNYHRVEVPENIQKYFSDFFTGFKRAEARGKLGGIVATKEGRLPFSESAYIEIAQLALKKFTNVGQVSENICYAILCWNLCARVQTASNLNLGNMSWECDSLVVRFGMSKSDQTGEIDYGLHLFANPITPSICPLLHIAIYILCQPILSRGQTLFSTSGDNGPDEGRFCSWLHKTLSGTKLK
jgi:hypothetical protein